MAWLFEIWTYMFWIPVGASAAMGWYALEHGVFRRPLPFVVWFLIALLLQFNSAPLSPMWTVGLLAQTTLAIVVLLRLKLDT